MDTNRLNTALDNLCAIIDRLWPSPVPRPTPPPSPPSPTELNEYEEATAEIEKELGVEKDKPLQQSRQSIQSGDLHTAVIEVIEFLEATGKKQPWLRYLLMPRVERLRQKITA